MPIIPPPDHNMTIKLLNFYVPISFYNINDNNNTIIINSVDYTITKGNYNASNLLAELQYLLNGLIGVSFDASTNFFKFTGSSSFTLDGSSLTILGFDTAQTSVGNVITSTYPIDLTGDNVVYFDVPNIMTPNLASSSGDRTSLIHSLNIDVPFGSVLYYENSTSFYHVVQESHISFFHVRLLGEDQKTPLDLQNHNWAATIEIGFVPKQVQPTTAGNFKEIYQQYLDLLKKGPPKPESF